MIGKTEARDLLILRLQMPIDFCESQPQAHAAKMTAAATRLSGAGTVRSPSFSVRNFWVILCKDDHVATCLSTAHMARYQLLP